MSFPPGTEMFQFPGFAFMTYVFSHKYFHMTPAMQNIDQLNLVKDQTTQCLVIAEIGSGLPHSEIHGSKPVRGSP